MTSVSVWETEHRPIGLLSRTQLCFRYIDSNKEKGGAFDSK